MISEPKARQLLERVIELVRATRGTEALVSLRAEKRGNTRFARNDITSSADVERMTLAITTQLGQRAATATTNQLDDKSIDDAISRAVRMAKLAPENPEAMPVLGAQKYMAAKGAVDAPTGKLGAEGRAKAVGAALAAAGATEMAGFYEHGQELLARATTAGLLAVHQRTSCSFSCTARTSDGTGSGWAGVQSNKAGDIDAGALGAIAAGRAQKSAKPRKLDPGRYTVILEPAAASSLLGFLIDQLDARRADEGRSYFSKVKVGDKLFPQTITLRSDPADAETAGMPFDSEGFALKKRAWIELGTLTGLTYSRYWAKKQNKPATGAPSGWTLEGGNASLTDLVKGVDRGVLITRFWYLRPLDPQTILVTGLTRDGTFLIENGEITTPVNNFRFNESPIQMLAKCDGLGTSVKVPVGESTIARVPILRTHEFNLASISEAV